MQNPVRQKDRTGGPVWASVVRVLTIGVLSGFVLAAVAHASDTGAHPSSPAEVPSALIGAP